MSDARPNPAKHYCGAYRPEKDDKWNILPDCLEKIQYIIGKWEWANDVDEPENGYQGMHWQYFMVTKKKTRIDTIHGWSPYWARAAIKECIRSPEENIRYVRKVETSVETNNYVYEYGICPVKGKPLGFQTALHWIQTTDHPTIADFAEKFPTEYVRNKRFEDLIKEKNRHATSSWAIISEEMLHEWQLNAIQILKAAQPLRAPHNRRINWFYDPEGHAGKSEFGRFLLNKYGQHKVLIVDCSAKERIVEALYTDSKPLVMIWDLERSYPMEKFNYSVLEMVKNGFGFRTMYNPQTVTWQVPHIFVFSNALPNFKKFTRDRWEVTQLSGPEVVFINGEERERRNDL